MVAGTFGRFDLRAFGFSRPFCRRAYAAMVPKPEIRAMTAQEYDSCMDLAALTSSQDRTLSHSPCALLLRVATAARVTPYSSSPRPLLSSHSAFQPTPGGHSARRTPQRCGGYDVLNTCKAHYLFLPSDRGCRLGPVARRGGKGWPTKLYDSVYLGNIHRRILG